MPALNRQPGRVEARAPREFYTPFQVSRGYPLSPLGGFAVTLSTGFPRQDTKLPNVLEAVNLLRGRQSEAALPAPKPYLIQELRLSAYQKAQRLIIIGEQQLRLGNVRRGVGFLEEALNLVGDPDTYPKVIKILLELNCPDLARDWATKGHALFPNDALLARWDNLLSLPRVRKVPARTTEKIEEVKWLEANSDKFRGKWVVLAGAQLVGVGNTLEEALQSAHLRGHTTGTLTHWISD